MIIVGLTHFLYTWRTYDAFSTHPTHIALYLLLFHLERSSFHQNVQKHKLNNTRTIIVGLTHYLYMWRTYDAFSMRHTHMALYLLSLHLEKSSFHQNVQKDKLSYAGMIIVGLTHYYCIWHNMTGASWLKTLRWLYLCYYPT